MTWRQFHNQPADSPLHRWLVRMWAAVRVETQGRVEVRVCPQNDGIAGGDPAALEMLLAGDVEFFTLMGGLIGTVVPVADMQGLPFAFRDHAHVFAVMDGEFGDFLRREMAAQGIYALRRATFENGFRHITTRTRPIRHSGDLEGLTIRTPAGRLFLDFFDALGARPQAVNLNRLHEALRTGVVEAQENPLVVTEFNGLWELQRYASLTGHMWSGFNLLANLAVWQGAAARDPGGGRGRRLALRARATARDRRAQPRSRRGARRSWHDRERGGYRELQATARPVLRALAEGLRPERVEPARGRGGPAGLGRRIPWTIVRWATPGSACRRSASAAATSAGS
jgi:tripartite ATP-independent transporter DctP family solute receptor